MCTDYLLTSQLAARRFQARLHLDFTSWSATVLSLECRASCTGSMYTGVYTGQRSLTGSLSTWQWNARLKRKLISCWKILTHTDYVCNHGFQDGMGKQIFSDRELEIYFDSLLLIIHLRMLNKINK